MSGNEGTISNQEKRKCKVSEKHNNWTVKNAYPLPLILEIMDKLKGARYFSKFTYNGATIMFKFNLVTNEKLHSKQIEDYIDPQSGSLECVTLWQPFKL
jgi:hypothetical protein